MLLHFQDTLCPKNHFPHTLPQPLKQLNIMRLFGGEDFECREDSAKLFFVYPIEFGDKNVVGGFEGEIGFLTLRD